jgi:hypothetical protein
MDELRQAFEWNKRLEILWLACSLNIGLFELAPHHLIILWIIFYWLLQTVIFDVKQILRWVLILLVKMGSYQWIWTLGALTNVFDMAFFKRFCLAWSISANYLRIIIFIININNNLRFFCWIATLLCLKSLNIVITLLFALVMILLYALHGYRVRSKSGAKGLMNLNLRLNLRNLNSLLSFNWFNLFTLVLKHLDRLRYAKLNCRCWVPHIMDDHVHKNSIVF